LKLVSPAGGSVGGGFLGSCEDFADPGASVVVPNDADADELERFVK
jgi:hypothetical protein